MESSTVEESISRLSENHSECKQDNRTQTLPQVPGGNEKPIILLITRDLYHLGLIRGYGQLHGYIVNTVKTVRDALDRLTESHCPTIVLELNLLKDGEQIILDDFVSNNDVQLYVMGEQWEFEQVANLNDMRVEDRLIKPVDFEQLDLHLRLGNGGHQAVFSDRRRFDRRTGVDRRKSKTNCATETFQSGNQTLDGRISVGIFNLDFFAKQVLKGEEILELTPKEFALFSLFLSHPGRVYSTEELIQIAWPAPSNVSKGDLYQYIYSIRQKIEENPKHPHWLLTIRKFGYKLRKTEFQHL